MNRTDIVKQAQAIKAKMTENEEQASDLSVLVAEISKLPYGQLKKVLTEPVLAVLKKYGYSEE